LFSISLITYQSEKVFAPLLLLILAIFYRNQLFAMKKIMFISLIVGLIILIPIIKVSFSSEGLIRLQGTSALSNLDSVYLQNAKQLVIDKQQGNKIAEFFDNRRFIPVKVIAGNYFSHFNPFWLFSNSGDEPFKAPNQGLFYLWELPALLLGLFFLIRNKEKIGFVLCGWILVAFVAPAITTQAPHAMRAINLLPVPQIIEAYGLVSFSLLLLKKKIFFNIFVFFLALLIAAGCVQFFENYFILFPQQQSNSFEFALSKTIPYINTQKNNYQTIILSNQYNGYQSYMFYLFFSKYDPSLYLQKGGTKSGGFAEQHKIDNVIFRPIDWQKDSQLKNTLLVGNIADFPKNIKLMQSFYNLDGKDGIGVYENN
jgi:hypothetical protein